jgi:hypothetical protein
MATFPDSSSPTLALQHVLDNVLCLDDDSPVRGALVNFWIFTINDMMVVDPQVDLSMDYYHPTLDSEGEQRDVLQNIPPMVLRNISLLQQWYREQCSIDARIWFTLSETTFLNWKALMFHRSPQPSCNTSNADVKQPNIINNNTTSEAEFFQRSIKRSPNDYTKFKDDSRWKQWHRHLKATAASHGLSNVLNPNYKPLTTEATDLFHAQNIFIDSVHKHN